MALSPSVADDGSQWPKTGHGNCYIKCQLHGQAIGKTLQSPFPGCKRQVLTSVYLHLGFFPWLNQVGPSRCFLLWVGNLCFLAYTREKHRGIGNNFNLLNNSGASVFARPCDELSLHSSGQQGARTAKRYIHKYYELIIITKRYGSAPKE